MALPIAALLLILMLVLLARIVESRRAKPRAEHAKEQTTPLNEDEASKPRLQRQKGLDGKDTELWVKFLSHSLAYRKAMEYSGMKPCEILSNTHGDVWQLDIDGIIVTIYHKKNPGNEEGWLMASCSSNGTMTSDILPGKGYITILEDALHKQTIKAIRAKKVCY
ncbi:MAG: hypothetical protein HY918_02705 [Candidatus Doudnabacteria bacterium]|nr:hypothetical protein [Candidatus Doudnabacteria bacterium]